MRIARDSGADITRESGIRRLTEGHRRWPETKRWVYTTAAGKDTLNDRTRLTVTTPPRRRSLSLRAAGERRCAISES